MKSDEGAASQPVGDLPSAQQRTIDILCQQFAEDRITVREFERRVDLANQATTPDELRSLLADLVPGRPPAPLAQVQDNTRVAPREGVLPDGPRRSIDYSIGVMGATVRKGRWTPAASTVAVGIMGGSELDFREAILPQGVTEVTAVAVMGGVEIIVPPGVRVETAGMALMGGFEDASEDPEYHTPATPVIRVKGFAFMGGIEIHTRLPGESARDARRRRRALKKLRKRKQLAEPDRS